MSRRIFYGKKYKVGKFGNAENVRKPRKLRCRIIANENVLEEVGELKCLRTVLCQNSIAKDQLTERTV